MLIGQLSHGCRGKHQMKMNLMSYRLVMTMIACYATVTLECLQRRRQRCDPRRRAGASSDLTRWQRWWYRKVVRLAVVLILTIDKIFTIDKNSDSSQAL